MIVAQPRLALVVALAAPLWLLPGDAGTWVAAGALVLIAFAVAIDVLLLPTSAAIGVARELGPSVGVGDNLEGQYVVSNDGARSICVELRDRLPALVSGGVERAVLHVPPADERAAPLAVRGISRGAAPMGPVGLRVTSSLGLLALVVTRTLDDEILVVPSVSGVRRFRLLAMQHRLQTVGVRALRRRGEGMAFASLREYVRGDDPRHVDWKATSKKGKLISREFTIERSQTVITLVDAGRGMTQRAGSTTRLEHALSAALVLTDVAANAGDRVGAMVFNDSVRAWVPPLQSRGALQVVRDAFTPVLATSAEPDYATAFRFLAARQRKRALIVFFTDVIDSRASQSLLAHVVRGSVRHLVLVVALRNDGVFESARPGAAGSAAAAYDSAAAEEVIGAREEALERMRRAGIVVLDVSPLTMTASVVNRYLELKSRGAL